MESSNFENNKVENQSIAPTTSPKVEKCKWIIWEIVAIILLAIGLVYYLLWNNNSQNISLTDINTKQFSAAELGITFSYPEKWGDVQKSITAHISSSPFDLQHKFYFSQNSLLTMQVNYLGEPEVFRQNAIYEALREKSNPTKEFCKDNLEFISSMDNQNPNQPHSTFRQNGIYSYGVCDNNEIYIIKARKQGMPLGLLELDKEGSAKIDITKSYVISSGNTSYSLLEIVVDLPGLISDEYAEIQWDYGDDHKKSKSYGHITYLDKKATDNAVKNFQESELNKELEQLIHSLSIETVSEQDANNFVENYFEPKSQYSDDKLGVKFNYPSILPEPVLSQDEKSISIDGFTILEVISRQDAIDIEKSAAECEGMCFGPSITANEWDLHLDILSKGIIDKKRCNDCESIATIGNNNFLVLFQGSAGYSGHPGKRYIIYQEGRRYEFSGFQNGFTLGTGFTLSEFNKMADVSLMQKVVKNIIGSVTLD